MPSEIPSIEAINFFEEDIQFELPFPDQTKKWILRIVEENGYSINAINYIFCSDEYLHKINFDYLDHDTYTDIITFDNAEAPNDLEGDIYISIERMRDNAKKFNKLFDEELHRVLIHGMLHLMGQGDKNEEERREMRKREEACLSLRNK